MRTTRADDRGGATVSTPPTAMTVCIGTEIGEYVIEGQLGHGGMGVVYAATHPMIGKRAAIKVLKQALSNTRRPSSGSSRRRARQRRSAIRTSSTSSRSASCPTAARYFVMELLVGESLRERLERGPLARARGGDGHREVASRARCGARQGHHPSRSQARQRVPRRAPGPARRQAARLRDREAAANATTAARESHRDRRAARHAAVHVARAARGATASIAAPTSTRSASSRSRCSPASGRGVSPTARSTWTEAVSPTAAVPVPQRSPISSSRCSRPTWSSGHLSTAVRAVIKRANRCCRPVRAVGYGAARWERLNARDHAGGAPQARPPRCRRRRRPTSECRDRRACDSRPPATRPAACRDRLQAGRPTPSTSPTGPQSRARAVGTAMPRSPRRNWLLRRSIPSTKLGVPPPPPAQSRPVGRPPVHGRGSGCSWASCFWRRRRIALAIVLAT